MALQGERVWSAYDPIPDDLEPHDPSRLAAEMIRRVDEYRDHMVDHFHVEEIADSMAADYHRLLIEKMISRQGEAE